MAIEQHRHIASGLLETVYELCLCRELAETGIAFARLVTIPVLYEGAEIGDRCKVDVVVAGEYIGNQSRRHFNEPRPVDGRRRYVV